MDTWGASVILLPFVERLPVKSASGKQYCIPACSAASTSKRQTTGNVCDRFRLRSVSFMGMSKLVK